MSETDKALTLFTILGVTIGFLVGLGAYFQGLNGYLASGIGVTCLLAVMLAYRESYR